MSPRRNPVTNWIRAHELGAFLLLTFAISWSLNGLVILLEMEMSWTRWLLSGFLSTTGPAIAAVVVVSVSDRRLREWARGIVRWRVHPTWYAAAVGIPAVIALGSAGVASLVGAPIDFGAFSPELLVLVFGIVLGTFVGGGQEEIGWRGFAQPELQQHYSPVVAALVVGVIWGAWHLPLFVDPLALHSTWPLASQVAYFVGITAFSILLAWVYNGTGGSILLVMVMHGANNALGGALVPLDVDQVLVDDVTDFGALVPVYVSNAAITVVLALVVVAVVGRGLLASRLEASRPRT
ncbi:CPBP family intramembrane glutamic endopeptidase [Natronobeatus ordinarius]|uniref:CPBP family intramembrane glutamic endopeptidase n=1 Tax=Natronobeatus ordinarius TaxID=2963433 RepID=UPI0020CBE1F3|nr:CPBP family intramembrane glutamic endopeptidase [Natronobeatus ordinarius]